MPFDVQLSVFNTSGVAVCHQLLYTWLVRHASIILPWLEPRGWEQLERSLQAKKQTRTETQLHKASLPFMVWAAQWRLLAEPCIIQENVEGFDPAVLVQLLGDMYLIFSVLCELMRLGIPCRRKRRITILVHKHRARATVPWDYKCIELCERHCALTFKNFMLSRQDEFQNQLNWAGVYKRDLAKDSEYKDRM